MIIVTGTVLARDGCFDDVLSLAIAHVRRSRIEPGCISHAVYRDLDEPLRLQFVERWADLAALKIHFAVPASGETVRALAALASERPSMQIYDTNEVNI